MMRIVFGSTLLIAVMLYVSAQEKPPAAPVQWVVDDYFGTKLSDPYRSTKKQQELKADVMSFALWQFGDPAFQPKETRAASR